MTRQIDRMTCRVLRQALQTARSWVWVTRTCGEFPALVGSKIIRMTARVVLLQPPRHIGAYQLCHRGASAFGDSFQHLSVVMIEPDKLVNASALWPCGTAAASPSRLPIRRTIDGPPRMPERTGREYPERRAGARPTDRRCQQPQGPAVPQNLIGQGMQSRLGISGVELGDDHHPLPPHAAVCNR